MVEKKVTNRLKRDLKRHEKYWKRIGVFKKFISFLCLLDLIDYRTYWTFEGMVNNMQRDKKNEYDKLMCTSNHKRKYGRRLNCWRESTQSVEREERRKASKLESQARYYEATNQNVN